MMRYISETVRHSKYEGMVYDSRGNEVESWGSPVDLGIYAFNPGTTDEPYVEGHNRVVSEPSLYVPSSAVVGAHDRIEVRGLMYEVNGDARDFRNPYGSQMDGLQIQLRRVTG